MKKYVFLSAILFLAIFTKLFVPNTFATSPNCGVETYEFENEGSNSRVDINVHSSDREIDATGLNGWTISNLWLDEEGGSINYISFGGGNKNDFNPSNFGDINKVKVEVSKSCATATPTRTATPTATSESKVYWCHCEPNGNCQTLHLPMSALTNAGHVSANGNPLHAGDYSGQCVNPTATPTATTRPTATATATSTTRPTATATSLPTDTATPVVTSTPTVTPTQVPCNECEPTATPTATATVLATPTATPNGDVCPNLDGVQLTIPNDYHLDAGGVNCVQFSVPGAGDGSPQ